MVSRGVVLTRHVGPESVEHLAPDEFVSTGSRADTAWNGLLVDSSHCAFCVHADKACRRSTKASFARHRPEWQELTASICEA